MKDQYIMRALSPLSSRKVVVGYLCDVKSGPRGGVTGFTVTPHLRFATRFADYDYAEKVAISLCNRYNLDVGID